jgi:hypothetical protein
MSELENQCLDSADFLTRLRIYPHSEIEQRIRHAQVDVFEKIDEKIRNEFKRCCKAIVRCV